MSFESRAQARAFAAFLTPIVFVNAALLFSVEPMFSKLVLPFLGGTPSVWNTCLVFFQAALLIGYGYAHALSRIRDLRYRTAVHLGVLLLSCLALPLSLRGYGDPPPGNAGIIWLLLLLATSLGAPFVVLASGGPLVQRWLTESGHNDAGNPYFLYAASNLGSLAALLSYPVLIEPWMTLSSQRAAWSVAYAILALVIAVSLVMIARMHPPGIRDLPAAEAQVVRPSQRASWVLYSAIPASLLVGVTTFISTDVAAVPLLWVLPLSIYLLTFAIVFSRHPVVPHSWMVRAASHALVIVAIPVFWAMRLPGLFGVAVHLVVLFIVAMVCHGELARRRPPAAHLTEFYVWVGIGGLIGGVFNALVAPVVFNRVYEYPIVLALAGTFLPAARSVRRFRITDVLYAAMLGAGLLLATLRIAPLHSPLALLVTFLLGVIAFSFRGRPMRFGLALAAIFAAGFLRDVLRAGGDTVLDSERSYFGVYRVARNAQSRTVTLYHGTTLHGAQSLDPARRLIPLTYYHPNGPSGDIFGKTIAGMKASRNVALVGLGAGSLACYGNLGERWTYYEIDPVVARIALEPHFFTFLRDCPPSPRIVLGDARLTLGKERGARFDVLVLDAFSSDAIPVHLLTREAFRGYLALLAPHGVIAIHISNDHLDLEPVVASVAAELGLTARIRRDLVIPRDDAAQGRTPAVWTILVRSPADLGPLLITARWELLRRRADVSAWTDDFSNIVRVFEWR